MSYLQRRAQRLALKDLKKHVVFGIVISSILLILGLSYLLFVVDATDPVWRIVAGLGAIGWIVTLLVPSAWTVPEKALAFLAQKIGGVLFTVFLTAIYAFLIAPVGVVRRQFSGLGPIASWDNGQPTGVLEGWREKDVVFESQIGRSGKAGLGRRFLGVLQFFAKRGHYAFIPALVILLGLGVALFFVKTSALAPFIYTLF